VLFNWDPELSVSFERIYFHTSKLIPLLFYFTSDYCSDKFNFLSPLSASFCLRRYTRVGVMYEIPYEGNETFVSSGKLRGIYAYVECMLFCSHMSKSFLYYKSYENAFFCDIKNCRPLKNNRRLGGKFSDLFILASCRAWSPVMNMGQRCFSETSVGFQRTVRCYVLQDRMCNHHYWSFTSLHINRRDLSIYTVIFKYYCELRTDFSLVEYLLHR
jgi:hypothetical protein